MSYSKGGHSLFRHVLYKGTTDGWWDMKYKAGAVGAEVASRLGPVIEKENAANRALNEKFQLENIRMKELEIEENNINANNIINELKIIHDSMNNINDT